MLEISSKVYFQFFDYLLFSFGLFFIGISFLLYFLKQQRKIWMKDSPLLLIIFFFFTMGLVVWLDLIIFVFNKSPVITNIHFYVYLLAYLILFEFGRRLLFYNNKFSLIIYTFPIIFSLLNGSHNLMLVGLPLLGNLMSGLGFIIRYKQGKINSNFDKYKISLLYITFFTLVIIYLIFMIGHLFFDFSADNTNLHWTKHYLEWSIQLLIGIVLIYDIINVRIRNQFEYQLKESLIKLGKRNLLIILIIFFIGFFFVLGLGKWSWEKEKEDIMRMEAITASIINKKEINDLINNDEIESNYIKLQDELTDITIQKKRIYSMEIILVRDGQFIYGVDTRSNLGDMNNKYGNHYDNPSQIMTESHNESKSTIEEQFFEDKNIKWLASYTPIYSNEGNIIAILETDITEEYITHSILDYRLDGILIIFSLMLFIFVLGPVQYYLKKEKLWLANYENILSGINEFICIIDNKGNIIYANDAMLDTLGLVKEELNENLIKLKYLLQNKYPDAKFMDNIINQIKENGVYYDEFVMLTSLGFSIPLLVSIKSLEENNSKSLYVFVGMNIKDQKDRISDMQTYFENTLTLLATVVDAKDSYTAKHSSNVAKYAKGIARQLNLDNETIEEIGKAALLHDIGKIYVPDSILKKDGPLNDAEWAIMKKHPEYGKEILEKAGDNFAHLVPYVYHHHERYDGKGYPTNMKHPSLKISILTLADAFDAMTTDRAYRKGMPLNKVREEIEKNSGTQFHPEVVRAFLKYIDDI